MSDSVQPHRRQPTRLPTRLPHPWDSPGKNPGVGCHFLLQCMKVKVKVKSLSRVRLFMNPWTAAYQAPLATNSLIFSKKKCVFLHFCVFFIFEEQFWRMQNSRLVGFFFLSAFKIFHSIFFLFVWFLRNWI